jgi:hypothetical protein
MVAAIDPASLWAGMIAVGKGTRTASRCGAARSPQPSDVPGKSAQKGGRTGSRRVISRPPGRVPHGPSLVPAPGAPLVGLPAHEDWSGCLLTKKSAGDGWPLLSRTNRAGHVKSAAHASCLALVPGRGSIRGMLAGCGAGITGLGGEWPAGQHAAAADRRRRTSLRRGQMRLLPARGRAVPRFN